MYRSSKNKMVKRTSVSAVVALGALATGVGIAGATTHSSPKASTSTTVSSAAQPFAKHGRGSTGSINGPGMMGRHGGKVTAVSATSITVSSPSGTSTTYAIDASTKVFKDRVAATVSDLAVGERVGIQASSTSATTAAAIEIQLARIAGQVVSVNASTITVADRDGFYRTVTVSGSTTYTKNGATATSADVTAGSFIMAEGTVDANHTTLDASAVGIGTTATTTGATGTAPQGMGPEGMGPQGIGPQGMGGMF